MLERLNIRISYLCRKLEYLSMPDKERARLKDELSKLVDQRNKYFETMEKYGWKKESSDDIKKR